MYKIANNIAPSYLIDLFQMRKISDDTTSSLGSVANKNFLIAKPKLNLFKNSLSYYEAVVWNSIPLEIKKMRLQLIILLVNVRLGWTTKLNDAQIPTPTAIKFIS